MAVAGTAGIYFFDLKTFRFGGPPGDIFVWPSGPNQKNEVPKQKKEEKQTVNLINPKCQPQSRKTKTNFKILSQKAKISTAFKGQWGSDEWGDPGRALTVDIY